MNPLPARPGADGARAVTKETAGNLLRYANRAGQEQAASHCPQFLHYGTGLRHLLRAGLGPGVGTAQSQSLMAAASARRARKRWLRIAGRLVSVPHARREARPGTAPRSGAA